MAKRQSASCSSSSSSSNSNRLCRRFNDCFVHKAKSSSGIINCCNNKNQPIGGGWGRLRKRQRRFDGQTDRLSVLPDDIIHHIFSYLDAHAVVQTSFLARRWRNLWTTCPHLNFHYSNKLLSGPDSFGKFVDNVLSYRNHDSRLQRVHASLFFIEVSDSVLSRVLGYATSHSVPYLSLSCLHGSHLPQQLSACKSLKTLSLREFFIPDQPVRLLSLTTLRLDRVRFGGHGERIDPFNAFPNLKNLSLEGCSFAPTKFVKISAPQLVVLKLGYLPEPQALCMDVDAPNLRTFTYDHSPLLNFSSVNLPSLEYADIAYLRHKDMKKEDCLGLFRLFQWLHNAQFLVIDSGGEDSGVVEALSVALSTLENQSSPFNRLKVLKLNCSNISSKAMSYLCNGSPHAEIKLLELPKV